MLIAMAVFDTLENERSWMTEKTLDSLAWRVDRLNNNHRIIVVDNGSCQATKDILSWYVHRGVIENVITLSENVGTARAINKAWSFREEGEHCVKMDNDVTVQDPDWPNLMEEVFAKDPTIGICGLKRKDCMETPWTENFWYKSYLRMLDHNPGDRWIIVEEVQHVMGTCQGYSSALLDKIGYLFQMGGLYGFDDALASVRAHVAGFKTVFVPQIRINHIDPGGGEYQHWKEEYAGERMTDYHRWKGHIEKTGSVYCNVEGELNDNPF
ncbi:MAG: glycosyltransferase [Pelodictyon phaeoclathratiforme]